MMNDQVVGIFVCPQAIIDVMDAKAMENMLLNMFTRRCEALLKKRVIVVA